MGIPLILPQNLPIPPSSGLSGTTANPIGANYATYEVFVQDASRNLVGLVDQYDKLTMVPRFNAVGSWALSLDAAHPMATYLKTRGYGIYVNRYIQDSNGHVLHSDTPFFAGPMRTWVRENKSGVKTLTVSGGDSMLYLASRDAWPVFSYPYDDMVEFDFPYGYWKCADTSGTVATDSSGNGRNGQYSGGFTLNQASPLDQPGTGVLLNGSTGFVNTLQLGIGDGGAWSHFTAFGWFKINQMPTVTNPRLFSNSHTDTDKKGAEIYIKSDGSVIFVIGNGTSFSQFSMPASSVSAGTWYFVMMNYTGSTVTCDLYHGPIGSVTKVSVGGSFSGTVPANGFNLCLGTAAAYNGDYLNGTLLDWCLDGNDLVTSNGFTSLGTFPDFWYNCALSRWQYQAEDAQSGISSSIMYQYVLENAAGPVFTERQVSGLSNAADPVIGGSQNTAARFENLIAKDGTGLLQEIARAASPQLGFKVTQNGAALSFSVYQPNDKTSSLIFSDEIGNLGDVTYEVAAPDYETEGNHVVVGGSGVGTARSFYLASDSTSITNWGRAESFVDKRDSSDSAVLSAAATSALDLYKEKVTFSGQLMPQSGMTYMVDFALGDKVTCVLDGAVVVQDLVREVHIDLDPASGEVVTIAVGTDGAIAEPSGNPSITGRFYGPTNATPQKHGKQPKKHLKGSHHARHVKRAARHQHRTHHSKQKLERRA